MLQIASAPLDTQAASLNMVKAYRNPPILPSNKCYLPVFWWDYVWPDHNDPFGLTLASGIQGMVADALVDVCHASDIPYVFK